MRVYEIEKKIGGIKILREDLSIKEEEFENAYPDAERVCTFPRYSYESNNSAWGYSETERILKEAEKLLSDKPYGIYVATFDYSFYRTGTAAGPNWYGRSMYKVQKAGGNRGEYMAAMKEMFNEKMKEYREIYQKYMQYEPHEMPSDEELLIALMDIDIKVMKDEGQ